MIYSKDKISSLLQDWTFENNSITRKLAFKDFLSAINFMVNVSSFCEKTNHHPEWTNVYNKLNIRLTTHDEGGITDKDIKLAEEIDSKFMHTQQNLKG